MSGVEEYIYVEDYGVLGACLGGAERAGRDGLESGSTEGLGR